MVNTVQDVMTKDVVCFCENDRIVDIAKVMKERNISGVIIKRGELPIGVITERDMSSKVIGGELDVSRTLAKDIMSYPVRTIPPETNVYYVSQLMKKAKFKRFPVTKNGKMVGIITQSDIVRFFNEERRKMVLEAIRN